MRHFKTFFGFVFNIFKSNKLYLFLKVTLAILQGLFPVFTAVLPQYLLDAILVDKNFTYFLYYVVLFTCLQFLTPFLFAGISIWLDKLLHKLNVAITDDMLDRLYVLKYEIYDNPENHNIINRAFAFSTGAGVSTFNAFLDMVALSITLVSYAYIIAKFNWLILLTVIFSVIVNYFIAIRKSKINLKFKDEQTTLQRRIDYSKNLILNKYQARDIHFNGTYDYVKKSFESKSYIFQRELTKKNCSILWLTQTGALFQSILTLFIMISFGSMLYQKLITVGEYTVSLNTSMQFSNVIFSFINLLSNIYAGILESKNYNAFLLLNEKKAGNLQINSKTISYSKIQLDGVSYQYYGTEINALSDFSYEFKKGKMYVILGVNGSGKSTLIKLLLGLYSATGGTITIDDVPLENMDLDDFYSRIAVVAQDFQFLDGFSIRENLDIDSVEKELEFERLTTRYGFPRIENLDIDVSKYFCDNGIELSGGEKQKLAFIRAMLRKSNLLVLDEPTSAIDSITEEKIFSDLKNTTDNKLIICITHNQKMAKYADDILIIENGRLLRHGTYEELIKANCLIV